MDTECIVYTAMLFQSRIRLPVPIGATRMRYSAENRHTPFIPRTRAVAICRFTDLRTAYVPAFNLLGYL